MCIRDRLPSFLPSTLFLSTYSEEISFYQGSVRERLTINKTFADLVSWVTVTMHIVCTASSVVMVIFCVCVCMCAFRWIIWEISFCFVSPWDSLTQLLPSVRRSHLCWLTTFTGFNLTHRSGHSCGLPSCESTFPQSLWPSAHAQYTQWNHACKVYMYSIVFGV